MSKNTIHVLLVEDNPGDAFLIRQMLILKATTDFNLTHVENLSAAKECLQTKHYDIILLDLLLPDSLGIETLMAIKNQKSYLPVVVLTGVNDYEKLGVEAVKQGAQDYLIKGEVSAEILVRSIRYAIERQRMEEDIKQHSLKLEALNQELEAFSYSVSHDLRGPLVSFQGFSSLLEMKYSDLLDSDGRNYLQNMLNASYRMEQIINDILQLSRVTRQDIELKPVDLSVLAIEIADVLKWRQEDRQVEFILPGELVYLGDESLLRVMLENLFNNAWKYTATQEKAIIEFGVCQKLEVKIPELAGTSYSSQSHLPEAPKPQDNEQLTEEELILFVRDNGVGFEMEYADKLFVPFQRLHSRSEFEGTGVGLATVQRIIDRHGGKIWAESEVDNGATFYFTLKSI